MSRTILVSNRLPVTIRQDASTGQQSLTHSVGGLVAALKPLQNEPDTMWIGYPGIKPDADTNAELIASGLMPVDLDPQQYSDYYDGYANDALWPLFHYFPARCILNPRQFESYRTVNRQFADVIARHAEPGDTVWVHDYHLMLLPEMLRSLRMDLEIGFFLHIPFPSAEMFRILPQRVELLRGLLGSDLIGMHTWDYCDHFLRSVRRVLGLESRQGAVRAGGHSVRVEAHPIGVDVGALMQAANSEESERYLTQMKREVGDRQVILGVERLDYSKGLTLKLDAIEALFERSSRWAERTLYIQLAVPTRPDVPAYQELRAEVERRVSEINGRFGQPTFSPISYLYQSVGLDELTALYRLADICFVSPVRDGLNLVAKEYVAVRNDGGGALVLSEFAGAASEMGEALRVNPWDVLGTARQLERGLEMSLGERNERMQPMRARVAQMDVRSWLRRFTRSLRTPDETSIGSPPLVMSSVLADSLASPFSDARNALIMLDYDGSLRELTPRFEDAVPTKEIIHLLTELSRLPNTFVAINSGRDRHTLGEWFADCPIYLIAEHGVCMRNADSPEWETLGIVDTTWQENIETVLVDYTNRTPGARIERKTSGLVWHYREVEEDLGEWQALELVSLLENSQRNEPVEVLRGSKVVEVRQQAFTKARAYDTVLARFGPFDFVLVTGDDRTDEDLFSHLTSEVPAVHTYTVKIGTGVSAARTSVSSPRALRELLARLVKDSVARNAGRLVS